MPKTTQGEPSGLSPLRSDGFCDGQAARLDCVSGGQKTLKAELNLKVDYQAHFNSGQMVLVVIRQGGWTKLMVAKSAQMSWETALKPKNLLIIRHSDSLKKSQLTLSQWKLKKGDDDDD